MVRIKHRYLLVQILYPSQSTLSTSTSTSTFKPSTNPSHPNALPPTISFHAPTPSLEPRDLTNLIRTQISDLFGDYGSGLIAGSLKIVYWSQATSTAIVRVSRGAYRLVWAALSYINRLPKDSKGEQGECVVRVLRVCGTVRKAEEEAIRRAREAVYRAKRQAGEMSGVVGGGGDTVGEGDMGDLGEVVVRDPMDVEDEDEDFSGDESGG